MARRSARREPTALRARPFDWPTLAAAAARGLPLVIYMGIAGIETIEAGLLESLPGAALVALVQLASLPQQRQVRCRLDALASTVHDEAIGSPAIVVVGEVAALAHMPALPAAEAAPRRSA